MPCDARHVSGGVYFRPVEYLLPGTVVEHEIGDDDAQPLEEHGGVGRIVAVVYGQHVDVDEGRDLGQNVFEPREQRRIVDRPFRVFGRVPLRHGQAVRRGQPVAVDLEIRGEAVHIVTYVTCCVGGRRATTY